MTSGPQPPLHFDVHPSVVFQLGADLISDDVQALIELVKNSYDADASYVRVEIDSKARVRDVFPETHFQNAGPGFIRITDNGLGMDLDAIRRGWLVVSNSAKRRLKAVERTPDDHRTPLGDKGLGRLASQRLARNLEVVTVVKGASEENYVGLSWERFSKYDALSLVPIEGPISRPTKGKPGTVLFMSHLVDAERWRGDTAKKEFADRLVELVSPFERIKGFDLAITIDGVALDRAMITKRLREEADATFALDFDGHAFVMSGSVKLHDLKPSGPRAGVFQEHCTRDGGRALFAHLRAKSKGGSFELTRSTEDGWFVDLAKRVKLDRLDKADRLPDGQLANPGPFRGQVDSFDLGANRAASALGNLKEFRNHVKRLAGVRVYRDGFGVRVDRDLLKLGEDWTAGRSWYGLKPANTIGYVAISARDNPDLVETTDREGFKRTPHYRNFEYLLREFVEFINVALQLARRETIVFCDRFVEERAAVTKDMKPEDLSRRIGEHLNQSATLTDRVGAVRQRMVASARNVASVAKSAGQNLFANSAEAKRTHVALREVEAAIEQAKDALDEVAQLLADTPKIRDTHLVLQAQIETFNERLAQAYETMGVGLTAEALVHEIATIADGLAERVVEVRRLLKGAEGVDERFRAFVRHVDTAVGALRKQLGHLDPALRYVRERREVIDLVEFLGQVKGYHEGRFRDAPIRIVVVRLSTAAFEVKINRGKLTQVFDNLILNSEYWLREDLQRQPVRKGEIKIELRRPFVWVGDNGRGIDPAVEGQLFEPFVTTKRNGRGLGLFIVREFLQSEGSSISLYQERNAEGRLFAFELDLSGMAHGKATE